MFITAHELIWRMALESQHKEFVWQSKEYLTEYVKKTPANAGIVRIVML